MNVFICHASEDQNIAERIQLALLGAGFTVFLDTQSLPAGSDFQGRIQAAIDQSEVFVFLITTESVAKGKFTLTELSLARTKWPHPAGHVLGVNLTGLATSLIPNYLLACSMLNVAGDAPTEVRAAVERLKASMPYSIFDLRHATRRRAVAVLAIALAVAIIAIWRLSPSSEGLRFEYGSGYFAKVGDVWVEQRYAEESRFATFREHHRDRNFIYLVDSNRMIDGKQHTVYVELPRSGGMSRYSIDNLSDWQDNFIVKAR
jgi:hypothetical protein